MLQQIAKDCASTFSLMARYTKVGLFFLDAVTMPQTQEKKIPV